MVRGGGAFGLGPRSQDRPCPSPCSWCSLARGKRFLPSIASLLPEGGCGFGAGSPIPDRSSRTPGAAHHRNSRWGHTHHSNSQAERTAQVPWPVARRPIGRCPDAPRQHARPELCNPQHKSGVRSYRQSAPYARCSESGTQGKGAHASAVARAPFSTAANASRTYGGRTIANTSTAATSASSLGSSFRSVGILSCTRSPGVHPDLA